jgi:hypothetical protein
MDCFASLAMTVLEFQRHDVDEDRPRAVAPSLPINPDP